MLILTRKIDERIIVDGNIVITVVEVCGDGKVRLGFEAPKEIPIHREEVYEQIHGPFKRSDGDGEKTEG